MAKFNNDYIDFFERFHIISKTNKPHGVAAFSSIDLYNLGIKDQNKISSEQCRIKLADKLNKSLDYYGFEELYGIVSCEGETNNNKNCALTYMRESVYKAYQDAEDKNEFMKNLDARNLDLPRPETKNIEPKLNTKITLVSAGFGLLCSYIITQIAKK